LACRASSLRARRAPAFACGPLDMTAAYD